MPVTQSAKKALRRDRRRTKFNQATKRQVKTAVKEFRKKPTKKGLESVYRLLDRTAKKKLFHQKKSDRLKSRLSHLLK